MFQVMSFMVGLFSQRGAPTQSNHYRAFLGACASRCQFAFTKGREDAENGRIAAPLRICASS